MKPSGASAVMADRARGEVAGDDARQALHRKLEYFPTPPWAARAIGEAVAALDPGRWWCWEPACGEGHMAHGLTPYFERVYATDIHDYSSGPASPPSRGPACGLPTRAGLCGSLQSGPPLDFLAPAADLIDQADWVFTNPPFRLAAEFLAAGLRRARRGVVLLCRSGWLDTAGRYRTFFGDAGQPGCDLELAFFDRVSMSLGGWEPRSSEPGGSTATAYSAFVWFQPAARPRWVAQARAVMRANLPLRLAGASAPIAGMASHGVITLGIPPGTKGRLTRPHDARDWGKPGAPLALFEQNEGGA